MSVAIGIPHPRAPAPPRFAIAYSAAGSSMPPIAAASGSAAWRGDESSPICSSRLISSPTSRKNTAIRPSLIQKWSVLLTGLAVRPADSSTSHRWKYDSAQGELAQTSATAVAAISRNPDRTPRSAKSWNEAVILETRDRRFAIIIQIRVEWVLADFPRFRGKSLSSFCATSYGGGNPDPMGATLHM
jgi:hypothetical protein